MPVLDATWVIDRARNPRAMTAAVQAVEAYARVSGEALVLPLPAATEVAVGTRDPAEAMSALEAAYDVVAIDRVRAIEAARAMQRAIAGGRRPAGHDADIAGCAILQGMVVVTRNAKDFRALGCRVWDYSKTLEPPP